jgi:hypothetical protein
MFGPAIFYPAMLGTEEDNTVKLRVHDQSDVPFGQ